jgi:hypothetical protein
MQVPRYLQRATTRRALLICSNPSEVVMGEAFHGVNELIPVADAACLGQPASKGEASNMIAGPLA